MELKRRVSRACDACKLRKVKCNGEPRCSQCAHSGLRCIYSATAKPRSQGRRGRVILEYKQQTSNPIRHLAPLLPRKDELVLDKAYFLNLLPDYMASVYPVQPILSEDEIRQNIEMMDTDKEAYSYVHAFGACTLNLSYIGDRRTPDIAEAIERLVNESINSRRLVSRGYKSSIRQCMTSLHLHNCFMTMRDSDASFFYMRDAITLVQLLGIETNRGMSSLPQHERAKRQRLYWEAYIHERFLAILDYRQAVMRPLQSLPEDDPTIPISVQEGFNQIIRLFQLLDVEFLQNWLGHHDSKITPAWIESKQAELDQQLDNPEGNYAVLNSMQKADLVVTKQWLKTLVWRLAMSNTLLSSSSPKECLSLLFPVRLSKQLRNQLSTISKQDIEIHGSGIVQKLFEITDTIADVIIAAPAHSIQDTANRVDDFLFLAEYLFTFPTLDNTRKSMVQEKLEKLQGMFPQMGSNPNSPGTPPFFEHVGVPDGPWYGATESMLPITVTSPTVTASSPDNELAPSFPTTMNGSLYTQYNEIARRLSVADFAFLKDGALGDTNSHLH
ncbi:uncharacterized protein PV09_09442 [Verruconis gallopava]|uniref:Zn(2)-C6 fungal-type domain-containing protein n=1 Tax=Verruconis gallopava TaxID=253628 RepID=A0A0D1X9F0_9PEZI|nr:uncharacterized protein PV09_09442 [Verruconis gallopava]KIV98790.1 hypothetical protein PV09_09442 [Verruconis gallopava]